MSMALIISSERGFSIGASSPAPSAALRNALFRSALFGSPKDTLLTPSTVFTPSLDFTSFIACRVSSTASCCAEAVRVRQSMSMSSLGML